MNVVTDIKREMKELRDHDKDKKVKGIEEAKGSLNKFLPQTGLP